MEAKDENDRMAIVSAPNSNTNVRITNEDLVELGFPDFLVEPFFDRKLKEDEIYRIFGKVRVDAELNFYNALYTLAKFYQKHTGKTMTVSHSGFDIYLNGEEVFRSYLLKKQNLDTIRNMVKELLTTKYNNDFEALEKEFARMYNEEEAKVEHDEKKIIDLLDEYLSPDEKEEYLSKLEKIVDLLEKEEFSEKKLYLPNKIGWFGEPYYLKPTMLRLKDALKYKLKIIQLSQNQNILILGTLSTSGILNRDYAIKLKENEKQELLDLLNSLGIQL